jgi:hypothetical protein
MTDQAHIQKMLDLTMKVKSGLKTAENAVDSIQNAGWLSNSSPEVRERAIRTCQALALSALESEVRARLMDSDPIVRLIAVAYYGIFNPLPDQHVKNLLPLLTDSDPDVSKRTRELFAEKGTADFVKKWGISWTAHPISAWDNGCSLLSPDRCLTAYFDGIEIAMGAPSIGTISIGSNDILRGNSSMIWSEDSRYLAFPKWNLDRSQTIGIFDIGLNREGTWEIQAGVFQTKSFSATELIVQVDPLLSKREETLVVTAVVWS